jgi:hypothetical protein
MQGKGSAGDKQAYTLRRRNVKKRIPVMEWTLSSAEQEAERGENRPLLRPTVLALSPCRRRAGC